jgi:acyl-CoA synthetase (AMP-forming)/AMP-acid ligase II
MASEARDHRRAACRRSGSASSPGSIADAGKWELSAMRSMIIGGSAAPEAMIAAFERHGLVMHAWGMTETNPLGTLATVRA